ncbi:MAG TPA: histidine--tRNA ligase [Phycisphaerae bacterium]|nr:histidine--tRNA ligase [Phycisphaerae bacterium]
MKFQAVKGTRDFYPEEMRVRNWIIDAWRKVSVRNGFVEYDAPIFEYLELFTVKSGEEIAEQLFNFTDRGGRNIAIRPEITPSLARMIAAKINSLPRPIKWFSVPRVCRAERPQRGRLREFFQWNVDIVDENSVQADAECIYVCIDFLREVGLTPADVKIHIGHRPLIMAMLRGRGVSDENMDKALLALDKRPKISHEAFVEMLENANLAPAGIQGVCEFMDTSSADALSVLDTIDGMEEHKRNLRELGAALENMGVGEYVTFDWHIVRGLAYYTGAVYEALAAGERAVAGGGRYDKLLEIVGGPAASATGFGMGDVVLGILLQEKGLIPAKILCESLDYYIIDGGEGTFPAVLKLAGELRLRGATADYSFRRQNVGKQLKEANRRGAKAAVIVENPDITAEGSITIKNLATGEQASATSAEILGRHDGTSNTL